MKYIDFYKKTSLNVKLVFLLKYSDYNKHNPLKKLAY